MQPHIERMIEEKEQLDERRDRLVAFFETNIFNSLDDAEKGRMRAQANFMLRYSEVLGDRIEAAAGSA